MRIMALLVSLVFFGCKEDAPTERKHTPEAEKSSELQLLQSSYRQKIDSLLPQAKLFIHRNNFNREFVFIADLSSHSGIERFSVVDLKSDSVVHSGLVAHGAGGKYWAKNAVFSNTPNSRCSSPGKYRIGARYSGRFGKAYKLHGLDKTNSKAFERFIVLHAYDCVPDGPVFPEYLCNSEGCPMVSYNFLDILSGYIDKSRRPILLWIVG